MERNLCAGYLAGTQAAGANAYSHVGTVNHSLNLTAVGLPGSVGLPVGVRNDVSDCNTLTANTALSHCLVHLRLWDSKIQKST